MSEEPRQKILKEYAAWTVLSAFRQGPMGFRSREGLDETLRTIRGAVDRLIKGPVTSPEGFNKWHKGLVTRLIKAYPGGLGVGWAAKAVNIYLKTLVYVGGEGTEELRRVLHPPIDGRLIAAVQKKCGAAKEELKRRGFTGTFAISKITVYETKAKGQTPKDAAPGSYMALLEALRIVAENQKCSLFEVEQYWGS